MATSLSTSSPHCLFLLKSKPPNSSIRTSLSLPLTLSSTSSSGRTIVFHNSPREAPQKTHRSWRVTVAAEDAVPSDAQQIVSGGDDGVYTVISVLLFIAFVGLSVLTIGVIYIAVTDFLQKREREKFEKEEVAKKKKGGKKVKLRSRTGPRGFGQKIDEDDEDD